MKKIRRKVNKPLLYFVFFVFASVTVGYAALSTTLSITGKGTLSKNSWDIHFENLVIVDNGASAVTTAPTIDSTKTKVSFNITLSKPGDSYEFTVDAVNKGTIDAMLSGFSATSLTTNQQKYLTYTVTYGDGATISTKDYLKKGTSETIRVRVRFRDDLTATDLPSSAETLNLIATLTYVQADSTAKARSTPSILCKRATTLHTTMCQGAPCLDAGYRIESTHLEVGKEITYGQLGTSGKLAAGDAFDCDVNGDGTYDSSTERFYYLTDLDSNTATLIYYNFTYGENNTNGLMPPSIYYNNNNDLAYQTKNGPVTAKNSLPSITDWSNVSLVKPIRNITNGSGTTIVQNFSYSGYAARLVSRNEILASCPNASTLNGVFACVFLLESSTFDSPSAIPPLYILTETVYDDSTPYTINAADGQLQNSTSGGLKPVIEVPKSRISY